MQFFVGLIGGFFTMPLIWFFGAKLLHLEERVDQAKAEFDRGYKLLKDYEAANPLDDNPTQDTAAQAKLIRALDDELQDTKQRVAMLTFRMNAAGMRRPTPEPSPTWEPRKPKTYEIESEIISPRPAPATTGHNDIAGDLYDDD